MLCAQPANAGQPTLGSQRLLGSRLVLSKAGTLDKFGIIALSSGPKVKMALYADGGGKPGGLVAQTPSKALSGSRQELDITDISLAAGTYYIMAIFDRTANISYTTATTDTVWYRSHAFASSLPTTFGTATTFRNQEYSYFLVMR